jgi:hypothetical protein
MLKISGLALALGLMASQPASAVSLAFTPSAQTVNVGDILSTTVSVTGLTGEFIQAYDFGISWNSSIIEYQSVNFDAFFTGTGGVLTGTGPAANEFNATIINDILNQNGTNDVNLLTLTFKALTAGTSPLGFFDVTGSGSLVDGNTFDFVPQVGFGDGSVTVTERQGGGNVPEPSILILMGAGLLGFAASRKRA